MKGVNVQEEPVKIRTGKDEEGKSKVVAEITVPVYEDIDELIENVDAKVILAKFNSQNKTDLANAERIKHKPSSMGKQAKRTALLNVLTNEEVLAAVGRTKEVGTKLSDELDALIDSPEIQSRLEAEITEEAA